MTVYMVCVPQNKFSGFRPHVVSGGREDFFDYVDSLSDRVDECLPDRDFPDELSAIKAYIKFYMKNLSDLDYEENVYVFWNTKEAELAILDGDLNDSEAENELLRWLDRNEVIDPDIIDRIGFLDDLDNELYPHY